MAVELAVAPEAELDLTEAYAWYEQRQAGLGEEFLSPVDVSKNDACLERIRARDPEKWRRRLP